MDEPPDPDPRPVPAELLLADLAAHFDLDQTSRPADLGGSRTLNLLVRRQGVPHVVRVHPGWTSRERVEAEQEVRRLLGDAGVPTVRALRTVTLSTGQVAELEPYVASDGRMNTAERLVTGYAELARVHDVLRRTDLPAAATTTPDANHLPFAAVLAASRSGAERIRGWGDPDLHAYAEAATELIEAVVDAERPLAGDRVEQVGHGDFWDDNVPFVGTRIAAVLDFGFMGRRLRIDDLALPFWFWLLEPGHGEPGEAGRQLLRALLDAYDRATERPLSVDERLSVPLVVARQPAWSVGHWALVQDEVGARRHVGEVVPELSFAQAILRDLGRWQEALG